MGWASSANEREKLRLRGKRANGRVLQAAKEAATMEGWMTETEAARYVGLSSATLRRLRSAGTGPAYGKPAKIALYKREDLDAWVRGQGQKAATP